MLPVVLSANSPSGSYVIPKSLRFRSSASAYLSRTPSATGSQTKATWNSWIKRGNLATGQVQVIFSARDAVSGTINYRADLYFNTDNTLSFVARVAGTDYTLTTSQVFRDPSSWYNICCSIDTTQATDTNRVKIYVNGSQITAFTTATYPPQNSICGINTNGYPFWIGNVPTSPVGSYYFDGYLAEVNFIDGQALTPSSFGETYALTGVWKPKAYSGAYGTNGFRLNFSNGTSTTTLGYDSSGNGNNWTTNNISLTAGSTYDWMLDSPTPFAGTSYGVGNYAVLNPLNRTGSTFSDIDGNLNWTGSSTQIDRIYGTIGLSSGKWYWEVTMSGSGSSTYYFWIGIAKGAATTSSYDSTGLGYWGGNDATLTGKFNNRNTSTNTSYGASWTFGDIIGVALDLDAGTLTFYKNGASQGVAISTINSSYPGTYFPMTFSDGGASGSFVYSYNFGQRPFAYTPPSGYKSLCTQNLPGVTIQNGADYMAATTYTGNGSTQTISGAAFQPDLVWVKCRSVANNHVLYDSVRGAGSGKALSSSLTTQEGLGTTDADSKYGYVSSLNSNGFSVAGGSLGQQYVNTNAATYIGWQWKAGGTAVTNTAGSITSSVSANTTAGFSVVTYTGTGANATVGHGLGVAPSMIIIKIRSAAYDWVVGHSSIGWGNALNLNNTIASTAYAIGFNSTAPTSSVFSVGTAVPTNGNGSTFVAYCFAAIPGYSAFGSYTGNGSADGAFIYTGFLPRLILVKCSSTTGNWFMLDTARNTYNVIGEQLEPNLSNAGSTVTTLDVLSNGFKMRTSSDPNASQTYVYAAFAANPFTNSLAC